MSYLDKLPRIFPIKRYLLALTTCSLFFSSISVEAGVAQSSSTTDRSLLDRLLLKQSSIADRTADRTVLSDGTYLFGQTEIPDQVGVDYAVFSVQDNRAVGAVYQPRSSFDCFSGQISSNKLSMNIVNSYDQTVYTYEIAVSLDNSLAAGNAAGAYTLDGFHRIDELSSTDREMLSTCKADLSE